MVVFTCNHCGESLQKPNVEKHYSFQCRKFKSLTCVDCFKDFKGEEYGVHTKCVTEEERYAPKGTYVGGIVKKGEVKQESWMEMIKSIVDAEKNLQPSVRNLLNSVSTCTNVPRKKNKFINFVRSSSNGRSSINDIDSVWEIIEKYKIDKQREKIDDVKRKSDDTIGPVAKKSKENDIFSFKNTILDILKRKKRISRSKLQKKFLKIYSEEVGNTEDVARTINKFNKKLKKIPNVTVNEENSTVLLMSSSPQVV